jgi:hypothetical protein
MWKGTDLENMRGDHYLVNWKTCLRPKKLGRGDAWGLGIRDLKKFNRALRLKCLWQSWDPRERQWKKLLNIHDRIDRALFFSSTTILIGDGRKTLSRKPNGYMGLHPKTWPPAFSRQPDLRGELLLWRCRMTIR